MMILIKNNIGAKVSMRILHDLVANGAGHPVQQDLASIGIGIDHLERGQLPVLQPRPLGHGAVTREALRFDVCFSGRSRGNLGGHHRSP